MYKNLEAEIKRKGLSRTDLARNLGITITTMCLKLSGKSNFTLFEAMQIKKILGVNITLEELFS